jgi:hypothetical protein
MWLGRQTSSGGLMVGQVVENIMFSKTTLAERG